jgi:hypothetical protein
VSAPAGPNWLAEAGWKLGQAGAAGAFGLTAFAAGIALARWGGPTALAVTLGALATFAFFGLGHFVQVVCARRDVRLILAVTLTTYGLQVLFATAVVAGLARRGYDRFALFAGVAAAVAGWVAGLVFAFRHTRIPVFDPPAETAPEHGMTSGDSSGSVPRDERSEGQRR